MTCLATATLLFSTRQFFPPYHLHYILNKVCLLLKRNFLSDSDSSIKGRSFPMYLFLLAIIFCRLARLLEGNSWKFQPRVQLMSQMLPGFGGGGGWLKVNYCTYKAILLDMPNQLLLQQHLQKPAAHF